MDRSKLINTFCQLGSSLEEVQNDESVLKKVREENPWFISENSKMALSSICSWLNQETLENFCNNYDLSNNPKKVGLVLAGNLPLVGFHDILCVLLSGNIAQVKPSVKDRLLVETVMKVLFEIDPKLKGRIELVNKLSGIDAFIGTGSDNTNRYFEHYFGDKPHVFRKNRTSIAVLDTNTTVGNFLELGQDIFSYFGFGCRNVSKVFIPKGFEIPLLLKEFESYSKIKDHHKYFNNYEYRRAIYLTGGEKFYDTGFLILRESEGPFSQIAELNFEYYSNEEDLVKKIYRDKDSIQVLVGKRLDGYSLC